MANVTTIQSGLIESFARNMDVAKSSAATYAKGVKYFASWLNGRAPETLTAADILDYKDYLAARGLSSLTIASYLTAVKKVYRFAESAGVCMDVARVVKTPKRVQTFRKQPLTIAETKTILTAPLTDRERAVVALMVLCGLRCIEVARLNIADVTTIQGRAVLMIQGKGHTQKDDFVILPQTAKAIITRYIESDRKGAPQNAPMFAGAGNRSRNKRLSTRSISAEAKRALQTIGINDKHYTAHSLRHTAAVNILRAGGTIEQAQFTLRHTSPATTQIYTYTLKQEQRLNNGGELLLEKLVND